MHRRYSSYLKPLSSITALVVLAAPFIATDCTSPDRNYVPTTTAGATSVTTGGSGGSAGQAGAQNQGGSGDKPCTGHAECDDLNDCNGRESCEAGFCKGATTLAPDGNFCSVPGQSGKFYCTKGNCEASRCGDGYVDADAKEDCDDANDVRGDGCEPGCVFTCTKAEDCLDDNICNGEEVCDSVTHTCKEGTPAADELACGTELWCNGGVCVAKGCGDGVINGAEVCDDDNAADDDGCKRDCTYTCQEDVDCGGGDLCVGKASCDKTDPLKPLCKYSDPVVCTPADECHTVACDPNVGCVQTLIDGDGDGYADKKLGACGTDCDDSDEFTNPGAKEICKDTKDNNCDDRTDEVTPVVWYRDCDGDDYAPSGAYAKEQCDKPATDATGCPPGSVGNWTSRVPVDLNSTDCNDGNNAVRPGNTTGSASEITNPTSIYKWDYNCSNGNDKVYTEHAGTGKTYRCSGGIIISPTPIETKSLNPDAMETKADVGSRLCFGTSYWSTSFAPACGGSGTLYECTYTSKGCLYQQYAATPQRCY